MTSIWRWEDFQQILAAMTFLKTSIELFQSILISILTLLGVLAKLNLEMYLKLTPFTNLK
jgi:uncharacterized membrane protein